MSLLTETLNQFRNPKPEPLSREEAIAHILTLVTDKGETYLSEAIALAENLPGRCLSDTITDHVLKALVTDEVLATEWKRTKSRGRPRKMYRLTGVNNAEVQTIVKLWRERNA